MKPVIGLTTSTLVVGDMGGAPRFTLARGYVDCVTAAGGLPLMFPNVDPQLAASYLPRIDGLVLTGGWDIDPVHFDEEPHAKLGTLDTLRDAFEIELIRRAYGMGIPILAICRGIQILNVALGGGLLQDIPSQVKDALRHEQDTVLQDVPAHTVVVEPGSRLHAIVERERVRVNTFHHQAVGEPAPGFRVTARSTDGVIEAMEDPEHPYCVCVQWHPERMPDDPITRGLFESFVAAAEVAARAGAR